MICCDPEFEECIGSANRSPMSRRLRLTEPVVIPRSGHQDLLVIEARNTIIGEFMDKREDSEEC